MTRTVFLFLAALLLSPLPAWAGKADVTPKNSVDYTMDDGIMSKEEMEMEAQDMFKLCDMNAYQKVYFNCACLAGAFLQQREKLGPMVMQDEIFTIITNSEQVSPSCANTEFIAGRAYESCLNFSENYSETELDGDTNIDYCTCVANKMANDFGKMPRLSSSYVETLRYVAMEKCRDPKVRAELKAGAAKSKEAAKAAASNAVPLPGRPSNPD